MRLYKLLHLERLLKVFHGLDCVTARGRLVLLGPLHILQMVWIELPFLVIVRNLYLLICSLTIVTIEAINMFAHVSIIISLTYVLIKSSAAPQTTTVILSEEHENIIDIENDSDTYFTLADKTF